MQDKRLKTLGAMVAQAVDDVRKVSPNRKVLISALREIAVNAVSIVNHIKEIDLEGFNIHDNLFPVEGLWNDNSIVNDRYGSICGRIGHHSHSIRAVPREVKEKGATYIPRLAEYF